ncbi:MAG: hypothetical protein KBS41_04300 [Oscillospiraceae bacterium]|nr:hypothetical protein [Candidatus Equicaccousia limihippi]
MLLFAIFGMALIVRLIIAIGYYNPQDTLWYKEWAIGTQKGFFNIYNNSEIELDYPPVYLFFLYITGLAYKLVGVNAHDYVQMFLMKFWPVIFDFILCVVLYKYARRFGKNAGIAAAILWMLNPAAIFNCAFWGQTDGLMCLLLLLSFWALEKHPLLSCVIFAIAGMTKLQCLYFTPVFLFFLYKNFGLKKFLWGIGCAAIAVAVVFLPFMIGCSRPALFFELYFGSANKYNYCTLSAYNLYGLIGLHWLPVTVKAIGNITYGNISTVLLVLSIVGVMVCMFTAKKEAPFVHCLMLMQCIFMLTAKMHERYQFVCLIFALLCYVAYKEIKFLYSFLMLTFTVTVNHFVPLFNWNHGGSFFSNYYFGIMTVMSIFNLIFFVIITVWCLKYLYGGKKDVVLAE